MWHVCDMDDGILRSAPTKRELVDWWRHMHFGRTQVRRGGSGDYAISSYERGAEYSDSGWIMTSEAAARHGFDPEQRALYPDPDDPFERVDRDEWERAGA